MKKAICSIIAGLTLFSISDPTFLNAVEKGTVSEIYFSPEDGVADRLISRINAERESIRVAVYCLMHTGIAKALKTAFARGVDVEVIIDPYSVKSRSPIIRMVEKGIPVYVWNPKRSIDANKNAKKPLMHDKFCVFGDLTVWTGSFNFTREGALANRENVVVMEGVDVAKSYLREFATIKETGCSTYQVYMIERQ